MDPECHRQLKHDELHMDLTTRIARHFEESARLQRSLAESLAAPIARAAEIMVAALLNERKLLACGNGASATAAQYFVSRMLNRFQLERPGLAAIALGADNATLSAIANDSQFEHVFSRQIQALGQTGDVLLAVSASGRSPSVLSAVRAAAECGMHIVALTGGDGLLMELIGPGDVHLVIPHTDPARIYETALLTLNGLSDAIDCLLLGVE